MKTGIIYKYQNKINGKIYIGQTTQSMHRRDIKHFNDKNNTYFDRAYKKYGKENFTIEIIEDNVPIDKLNEKEIFYIKKYNSLYVSGQGYNMTKGGQWGNSKQKVDGNTEILIKKLLFTTNISFKEISEIAKVSYYTVSDINQGRSLRENINYPIRKTTKNTIISESVFKEIINKLKYTTESINNIALYYNISEYTVGAINRGESKKYKLQNEEYPIRKHVKENTYMNKLDEDKVKKICIGLIRTNSKIEEIAQKYGVKRNTIGDISRGISWKEITQNLIKPLIKNKDKNKELLSIIDWIV